MVPVHEAKELKALLLFDLGLLFQQGSDRDNVRTVLVSINDVVTSDCFATGVPIDVVYAFLLNQVVLVPGGKWFSSVVSFERIHLLLPGLTVGGDIERHTRGNFEGSSINGHRVDLLLPELSVEFNSDACGEDLDILLATVLEEHQELSVAVLLGIAGGLALEDVVLRVVAFHEVNDHDVDFDPCFRNDPCQIPDILLLIVCSALPVGEKEDPFFILLGPAKVVELVDSELQCLKNVSSL